MRRLPLLALALMVGAAAVLRFTTLGRQAFWYDEGYTAYLAALPTGRMFDLIPVTESTPPVYYVLIAGWERLFGDHESALRSFSTLLGVATVPAMYLAAREFAGRRAGLIAAALAATSPLLVWYSQEARSYALLTLLAAIGLWLFARAYLRGDRAALMAWGLVSALSVATHYLAVLTFVPQTAFLLGRDRRSRSVWAALALVVATGLALLPLAIGQLGNHHVAWINDMPLGIRLGQLVRQFGSGFGAAWPLVVLSFASLGVAFFMARRAEEPFRRRAAVAAWIAGGAVLLELLLGLFGADQLITRNLIAAWPPVAVAVAIGLAQTRPRVLGPAAAALLCAAWIGVDLQVASDPTLQKPDWRRAMRALGPARTQRLVVLERYPPQLPVRLYDPAIRRVGRRIAVQAKEVAVIVPRVGHTRVCWWGATCNLNNALPPRTPTGLRLVSRTEVPHFLVYLFSAGSMRKFRATALRRELGRVGAGAVLVQPPRGRQVEALRRQDIAQPRLGR